MALYANEGVSAQAPQTDNGFRVFMRPGGNFSVALSSSVAQVNFAYKVSTRWSLQTRLPTYCQP